MKKAIITILIGLVTGTVGFFVGKNIGHKNGTQSAEMMHKIRSVNEIKSELKEREVENIYSYLGGKASIRNINKGSYFRPKYVQYFIGTLTNSATFASAKDVKLNVDFLTKTGTIIGNKEITIYDFISPGDSIYFEEKIKVPKKFKNTKWEIIEAKSE